ncbi:hypothetical protein JD844_020648 [Phrynosoma platyrhinos]|uniref:Exocyst complex component 3-like protein 4 n=1 Tax=Phrynosoma platyrhinos TaxID=52577 RepID=A0ABQ7SSP4_PHRPL|nr:hypothetical protein JD844_020648 [Phrynosoma platyrhinos]
MDENKIERKVANGQTELPSESEFPTKCLWGEDVVGLPLSSPPFNNHCTTELKTFTKSLKHKLSFRKDILTSVTEKSTEAKINEKKKKIKEAEGKTVLQLQPASPAKWMENEDSNGLAKKSPPFHEQEENEPKLFTRDEPKLFIRGIKPRKHIQRSFKEESAEVKMDENKTEKRGEDEKTELSLKQFLVKGMENENGNCLSTASLLSNNPGNDEPKSSNMGLKVKLSFGISRSVSMKEKTTKDAGISGHSSKRFKVAILKLTKDSDQFKEESNSIQKKNEELEGEAGVLNEPLSVMEIHELIQKRQLLEAFKNIRGLEMELLAEGEAKKYEDTPKEYTTRVKDVNLLYDAISKEIQQIVEKTLDLPRLEVKGLITEIVALIEEEEKIHTGVINIPVSVDPVKQLGLARNWGKLWKIIVKESVKMRIDKVPIPLKEDNTSWLSVHLGFLQRVIKEDLLTIMHWVQKFYPRDFNVCSTYLKAFHEALAAHLQRILVEEENHLKLCQFYALLHWVTNIYYSDDCLGHPDLRPEIKTEDLPSLLTPDVMDKLKNGYINSLKWETKSYLENILHLESEKWNSEEQLEALQSPYHSSLSFDIQTVFIC